MVVSIDVGQLSEASRALSRVVSLRAAKDGSKCVDNAVLARLIDAVTRVPWDAEQAEISRVRTENVNEGLGLYPRVRDLFEGVLIPNIADSPMVFRAYAKLLTWQGRWADALKAYMDAYRAGPAGQMQKGEEVGIEAWRETVQEVEEIVDVLRNFGERAQEQDTGTGKSKWVFQARSIVRTFMGKTRENFEDEPEWQRLVGLLSELQEERE